MFCTNLCLVLQLFFLMWYKQSVSPYWMHSSQEQEYKALYLHSLPRNSSRPRARPGHMFVQRSKEQGMSQCCLPLRSAWSCRLSDLLIRCGYTKCGYEYTLELMCSLRLRPLEALIRDEKEIYLKRGFHFLWLLPYTIKNILWQNWQNPV